LRIRRCGDGTDPVDLIATEDVSGRLTQPISTNMIAHHRPSTASCGMTVNNFEKPLNWPLLLCSISAQFFRVLLSQSHILQMAHQISDLNNCIFVHVPKAAGSSIEGSSIFDDKRKLSEEGIGGHATAMEFKQLYPEKFDQYFKFTFVRNPYSRLISAYFYLSRGGGGNEYDTSIYRKYFENKHVDFTAFVEGILSEEMLNDVLHLKPQYTFLCDDDGILLVDFIGRQEHFLRDAKIIFNRLKLPLDYRHVRRGKNKHFSYYYSKGSQDKVFNLYRKDFEMLDYGYDIEKPNQLSYHYQQFSGRLRSLFFKVLNKAKAVN
jgi:hypothetical protein